MGRHEEDLEKAEETLRAAYMSENKFPVSPEWQAGVMRHIRSIEASKARKDDAQVFGGLVWRFAATTGILSAALLLYALNTGVDPENLLLNILLNDPAGFTASELILP